MGGRRVEDESVRGPLGGGRHVRSAVRRSPHFTYPLSLQRCNDATKHHRVCVCVMRERGRGRGRGRETDRPTPASAPLARLSTNTCRLLYPLPLSLSLSTRSHLSFMSLTHAVYCYQILVVKILVVLLEVSVALQQQTIGQ